MSEFVLLARKFIENIGFLFSKWYYTFLWLIWFKSYENMPYHKISRLRDGSHRKVPFRFVLISSYLLQYPKRVRSASIKVQFQAIFIGICATQTFQTIKNHIEFCHFVRFLIKQPALRVVLVF